VGWGVSFMGERGAGDGGLGRGDGRGTYVAEGVGLGEDACGGVAFALFGGDVVGWAAG
jgi:hypothetical protein